MSTTIKRFTTKLIDPRIMERTVALTRPNREGIVKMPSYVGKPMMVLMSDTHGEIETVLRLHEALPSGLYHIDLGDKVDRGPDPVAMSNLLQTLDIRRALGNHDAMWLGAGLGIKSLSIELVRWLMRYNEVEFLTAEDQMGIDVSSLREYADKYFQDGSHRIDVKSKISKKMEAASTYLKIIAEAETRFPQHKKTILSESDLRIRRALFFKDSLDGLADSERERFLSLTGDTILSEADSNYFYRLMGGLKTFTEEEDKVVNSLAEKFKDNYKFYNFVRWMIGEGDLHFTFRTRQGYPCDIISTHALIPIDKDGNLKEVYGETGHDAFEKIKKTIRLGMESWRHMLLGDPSMLQIHEDRLSLLADLPWGVNSPVYGRQMQTAARAVLKESSGLWEEPKEPFFSHFEKNKDPEMVQRAKKNIAQSFKVDPENFVIVHGHEPVKTEEKSGIFKILAGGSVINIDAGMAFNYGGKGGAIVFGTNGAAWLSYPELQFSRVPLPTDSKFLTID